MTELATPLSRNALIIIALQNKPNPDGSGLFYKMLFLIDLQKALAATAPAPAPR